MFTGIIQATGHIAALQKKHADMRVSLDIGQLALSVIELGDSIAVSGICLTVTEKTAQGFTADVSGETLSCTTAGDWTLGSRVNLEMALTPASRLGGHIVSGHVDGVGNIVKRWPDGRSERLRIKAPDNLAKYIAAKGAICIDGVSLTVNTVSGSEFEIMIVPHTLQQTTMADYVAGQGVNLEVDVVARYLERLLLGDKAALENANLAESISKELLIEYGFITPNQ
ncbi:MAG: riboflavin synthase [Gammaproteobacteria bacterium]|nr:riboflavin synthase [Gammaproteobacteria bacterium]